jgi:acetylornithine deacetylase/succinyl-diaminopimelate desuccinylase-like protein
VTACPDERLDEVRQAATFIYDYLRNHGLEVAYYDQDKYQPSSRVPGEIKAQVMLSGHFDVVEPEPDDSQFEPRQEGLLVGAWSSGQKTVVATYLVWLKDALRSLLLILQ